MPVGCERCSTNVPCSWSFDFIVDVYLRKSECGSCAIRIKGKKINEREKGEIRNWRTEFTRHVTFFIFHLPVIGYPSGSTTALCGGITPLPKTKYIFSWGYPTPRLWLNNLVHNETGRSEDYVAHRLSSHALRRRPYIRDAESTSLLEKLVTTQPFTSYAVLKCFGITV